VCIVILWLSDFKIFFFLKKGRVWGGGGEL